MKVAILMPLAEQRGGAEQLLRLFLRHAPGAPDDWPLVFFETGPLVDEARALGFPVQVIRAGRLRQLVRYLHTVRRLARWFRQEGIALVLSWMGKAHLYGGVAARLAGVPAVWFQHGIPAQDSWMDRWITRVPAVGVLACSEAAAAAQRRLRPVRPVAVVHPAAELTAFEPDRLPAPMEARRQLGLPESGPLIGMVGRLQRWKGMHTLVQAMPHILERHPDARAVIVGGRHELEPDYEPWIVVVEAMALGKPVVAGAEGGPREIITEGVDGLLAPYEDAEALARQILRYLDDPAFARRVGEAARRRARDFSPEAFARRVMDVLRDFREMPERIAPEAHEKRRAG